jgi:hypothetical protein
MPAMVPARASDRAPSVGERRRRRARRAWLGAVALVGAVVAVALGPSLVVRRGVSEARACLEGYRAVRGPTPPSCWEPMRHWVAGARFKWTFTESTYLGEELKARIAAADYWDACVGRPDATRRAEAARTLREVEGVIEQGSKRINFYTLGRPLIAPRLGRYAELTGDDATLLERWDYLSHWQDRMAAIDAVIDQAEWPLLVRVGKRYAEFDPRDADLRVANAALLCLEPEGAARGLELLSTLAHDRANDRHANFVRDFGDVRLVQGACAARAGLAMPAPPSRTDQGRADRLVARATQSLRLDRARDAGVESMDDERERRESERGRAAEELVSRSTSAPRKERLALFAALVASDVALAPERAAELARALTSADGELTFRTTHGWLLETFGEPWLDAPTAERALTRLVDMLPLAGERDGRALREVLGALALDTARARALGQEPDLSLASAELGLEVLEAGPWARAVTRSSVLMLVGEPLEALAELDAALGAEGDELDPRAAALTQRAELLALLGREADEAAIVAEQAARGASTWVELDARLCRLALAPQSPLRDGTRARVHPAASTLAAGARARGTEPLHGFDWLGVHRHENQGLLRDPFDPSLGAGALLAEVLGDGRADDWLGRLAAARESSDEARRALRYRLVERRGDFPPASPTFALLVTQLLGASSSEAGDPEVFLDAALAVDRDLWSHRAYTYTRAAAAALRGDQTSEARWRARYRALGRAAARPELVDVTRALRF